MDRSPGEHEIPALPSENTADNARGIFVISRSCFFKIPAPAA